MTLALGLFAPAAFASEYDAGVFEFQQKLAKGGNAQAQYQLATMYESGRGVEKSVNKAREWYEKAAANNFTAAKHRITYLDIKTRGFTSAHKSFVSELANAARKGDGEAMFILGDMYQNGIGVAKDLKRARDYYKSSATRGNVDAENRLYAVELQMNQDQQNKLREEAAQKQAEQAQMARQKATKEEEVRQARMKAEAEKNRLEAERRRLEAERRKLEAQQRAIQAQRAAQQKAAAQQQAAPAPESSPEDNKFEAELCSGKAARFRTQCN